VGYTDNSQRYYDTVKLVKQQKAMKLHHLRNKTGRRLINGRVCFVNIIRFRDKTKYHREISLSPEILCRFFLYKTIKVKPRFTLVLLPSLSIEKKIY
jgi:hypothetical protein